ncbi:hypothetical protein ES708_30132 [subsurface metagenome]
MLQKTVKMMRIPEGEFVVNTDATPGEMYSTKGWYIDDKIRVIGVHLYGSLSKGTLSGATENSNLHGECIVHKGGLEDNTVICAVVKFLWGDDVTIGGSSHLRNVGDPSFAHTMFFPEGHGIDMDPGDYLYCHLHLHPIGWAPGAGSACMCGSAIIYYVER